MFTNLLVFAHPPFCEPGLREWGTIEGGVRVGLAPADHLPPMGRLLRWLMRSDMTQLSNRRSRLGAVLAALALMASLLYAVAPGVAGALPVPWTQVGADIDGEAAGDQFGFSVAVDAVGDTVIIGAILNDGAGGDAGHVRVLDWDGSAWVQRGDDIDSEPGLNYSGFSVAVDAVGDTVIIGAILNNGAGSLAGHVRVFDWDGAAWVQRGVDIDGEAAGDLSGYSVAVDDAGDTVIIGAVVNDGAGVDAGHVRVFDWDGAAWVQRGVDIDGEAAGDLSGTSVAVDGSGDTVIIGAVDNDGTGVDAGHVRVFDWDGSAWVQRGQDIDGEAAGDQSGWSVAVDDAGDTVIIGARFNDGAGVDAGHVRVFDWDGSAWVQRGDDIDGEAAGDNSGHSVAINDAGDTVVIGALLNDGAGSDAGHVRVFVLAAASNEPPAVDAGGPYSGDEGTAIGLSGASALDPDGDTLTYSWTVSDALCSFDDAMLLNPELTCSDNGTFTATLSVEDGTAPAVTSDATVTVSNVAPAITAVTGPIDPVDIGDQSLVSVDVTFTDPGSADTHDVTWDWDDGTVNDTQSSAANGTSQAHVYAEAGVYTVSVTVTDDDGGLDTEVFEFVVVYDPSAGFVTGGGWIDSPAGAYGADPESAGKATFGFVSKYKKGANVPTGNTEFQFKAGNLNFHSGSYDWLVIAGQDKAKYKGTGTINGSGNYGFMLTAVDNGNSGDTFRIKIWDKDNGDTVVYDNKLGGGGDDGYVGGTVIGGGNIKVHNK